MLQGTAIASLVEAHPVVAVFHSNGDPRGFSSRILTASSPSYINPDALDLSDTTHSHIAFVGYPYKNQIEARLHSARPNTLGFPDYLLCPAEQDLAFEGAIPALAASFKIDASQQLIAKAEYIRQVEALKAHIQQGDIYEINYCFPVKLHARLDPWNLYTRLNQLSKAPFSAFAKFEDLYIICSSPERFLQKTGQHLITQPIKGTAPRGRTTEEDEALKTALSQSLKERTENIMIVDVARNDLSRIATRGSVQADRLYEILSYEQVHQMVSTVSCEPRGDLSFKDILQATFPMASMTGAPKIRAMELADQYEPEDRGPYSGCLGYIDTKGDFDLNVLIRSIFYNAATEEFSFSVGSAITQACDPVQEYEECLVKARAMLRALAGH